MAANAKCGGIAVFRRGKSESDVELRGRKTDLFGYVAGSMILAGVLAAVLYVLHTLYVLVCAAAA